MQISNGNPGNNIIKWDGINWKDIGFGNTASFIGIRKTLIYHNQLWVFGSFTQVAGSPASNIAMYDGTNWCVLPDTVQNNVYSVAVYRDTIYLGGGFTKINSDTNMAYVAKLKYPTLYSQCVNVGIIEFKNNSNISLYPNPTNSTLNIVDEQNQLINSTIEITNYLGQCVFSDTFSNQIDVSHFSSGVYTINIKSISGELYHAKFVKE